MRKFILAFFISFLLLSSFQTAVNAQSDEVSTVRNEVIDLINKDRLSKNLKKIEVDENLCLVARSLAEESERMYPEKLSVNLYNEPYKKYVKNYSKTQQFTSTYSDVLVKAMGKNAPPLSFSSESLARQYSEGIESNLTDGCVAASTGKVGYKPYAYFVGGVRKNFTDGFPFNWIKLILFQLGINK